MSDPVLPVDTRPRTVVRRLNGIECERTYYVYSPLTNIVERVGVQGAAYGGTNVLRTVTAFYPVVANDLRSGFVQSIRHEDGKLDLYDYELSSNCWIRTVTHLHEQSPSPVSGKTTRDITIINSRGEATETRTEAYIDGIWYTIARNRMTYNAEGKLTSLENLAGQVTTTAWDCCHKISETQPDGSTTTWDYDEEGRMIAASRLIPLDMTNVTWLTTCYEYDDLGRQVATWQTNYSAQVGLPATRTRYDAHGRVIARVDQLGNTTSTVYSPDGRTLSVLNPNTSTRITTRSADGDTLSITGSAVTPEFHTYGILPDGTRWSRIVQGETDSSHRFTKRYENLLGQAVREERSGFQGAVLSTTHTYDAYGHLVSTSADYEPTVEYTYDVLGNRVATTKTVGGDDLGAPQPADTQWRKSESLSHIAIIDGDVWLTQTNIVSCSDSAIAPLVSSSARQLSSLTAARSSCSRSFDVRGNVTVSETLVDSSFVTSRQTLPYATNKPLSVSRYGVSLMDVSVSAVTNTVAYDPLGRQIAHTDGRGNTRHTEYNALGQQSATVDALGNRTVYAYDQFGHLASITDPIGNATIYEYDLRGRKTYEGGATYPVRYTYDVFGNKTTMMTYRNESLGPNSGDVTTWLYDIASGCMTNKVYADGKGPTYSYTPDGNLSQRTWARGIITDYAYDGWNNLTNTTYSDDTPTVSLFYDAMGRQIEAHDAAGVTIFAYDVFGLLTNETVIGIAGTNVIERCWDAYSRDIGYSLNSIRQSTLVYDLATGRLASMQVPSEQSNNQTIKQFSWSYLPGSDLKSSLAYPNGLSASWAYDANNQLLQVCNATPTNIISQYDCTYDAAGFRIGMSMSGAAFTHDDTVFYGYNYRNELTNACALVDSDYQYSYCFDDMGNRETSNERGTNVVYAANSLNQYTSVNDFMPEFDEDGNQILIKTATGVWQVQYNGENRPIQWSSIFSNIVMKYDRLGRRVWYNDRRGSDICEDRRFAYNNRTCVVIKDRTNNSHSNDNFIIWAPDKSFSTLPLISSDYMNNIFYMSDANANMCETISDYGNIIAHQTYAPFGAILSDDIQALSSNHFLFSSEIYDKSLGLMYYNYRHYSPNEGRWLTIDPIYDAGFQNFIVKSGELVLLPNQKSNAIDLNVYNFLSNDAVNLRDFLGLCSTECKTKQESLSISADLSNGKFGQLLNSVLGVSFSIDYTHTDTITTCGRCCGSGICGFMTTTESEEQFSGSIGKDAWNVVEVAISYSVSGSYSSTYDSCTSTRTNTGCGTTSISVSAGPCIKIGGDLAKFCIKGSAGINHKQCADGTNEWSGYGNIYFENCLGWFCGSGVIWSW